MGREGCVRRRQRMRPEDGGGPHGRPAARAATSARPTARLVRAVCRLASRRAIEMLVSQLFQWRKDKL